MDFYLRMFPSVIPRLFLSVVLACVFGIFSFGATHLPPQDEPPCGSAKTTADMRSCENIRYQKAQQDLNAVYEKLLNKLDAIGKAKLRAAQAAWLQFRKANADFSADAARGGTMAPLIAITVLTEMTQARTADLKKSLQQE